MCLKAYQAYSVHPDLGKIIVIAHDRQEAHFLHLIATSKNGKARPGPHHVERAPHLDKHALVRHKPTILGNTP